MSSLWSMFCLVPPPFKFIVTESRMPQNLTHLLHISKMPSITLKSDEINPQDEQVSTRTRKFQRVVEGWKTDGRNQSY